MLSVNAIEREFKSQAVSAATTDPVEPQESGGGEKFDLILKAILPGKEGGQVSEEELFSALIGERIRTLKGDEVGDKYEEVLKTELTANTRADGVVFVEDAARAALASLVASGDLTAEDSQTINAQAFAAAQLDDNKNALFDGRGSANDPTIAVESMEAALIAARQMIEKFDSGELETPELPTSESLGGMAGGTPGVVTEMDPIDGNESFLWKPISDNQGRLAVLFPAAMEGDVVSMILKDETGNEIERGTFSSFEKGREKYNFAKKGEEYPDNVRVEITLQDGRIFSYKIPEPSKRYD